MKVKICLYHVCDLFLGKDIILSDKMAHYLSSVMRSKIGDIIGVFNGCDGEYACEIISVQKKTVHLRVIENNKPHLPPDNITLIFALIKKTPLEYMLQKATELGVGRLQPIITQRTVVREINEDRAKAIIIEAAEQCGLTALPEIMPVRTFTEIISAQTSAIFCDETGQGENLFSYLQTGQKPNAIIVGPEGGFSEQEHSIMLNSKLCHGVDLGPRVMRAETAALSALSACMLSYKR